MNCEYRRRLGMDHKNNHIIKSVILHQLQLQSLHFLAILFKTSYSLKMENLPVEVLEIIFKELCSLEDIQRCYKTCTKWQKIIYKMFQDRGI